MSILTALVTGAIGSFTNIGTASAITVQTVAANFAGMVTVAMASLTALVDGAVQSFTNIGSASAIVIQTVAANMQGLQQVFENAMTAMMGKAADTFGTINTIAATVSTEIGRSFLQAVNAVIQAMIKMLNTSTTTFNGIRTGATLAANTINNALQTAANNALNAISQLGIKSATAFQTMINNATKVADAIKKIGDSANQAKSAVDSLRSSVESLPNINRTITYTIRTVGSAPSLQTGTEGQLYFDEGSQGTIFLDEGSSGIQTRRRAVVGETNDERVTRTGLRTGKVSSEVVTGMRTLTNLGMHEPEMLNVTPLKGYYAQRFKERLALGGLGSGIMGGIGKAIKNFFAAGTESPQSTMVAAGSGFGVSSGARPNTAAGAIVLSSDGKIHTREDGDTPLL